METLTRVELNACLNNRLTKTINFVNKDVISRKQNA